MTQPDMLVQVRTVQSLEVAMLTPEIKWGKSVADMYLVRNRSGN